MNHKNTSLPDGLAKFDSLPDGAFVRAPTVAAILDSSINTVWRYAKAGIIPAPQKLGPRLTAWNVGELRRALNSVAA